MLFVLLCFLSLLSRYVYSECCAVFRFVSRSYRRSFSVWLWECWSWSWSLVWFVRWYYVICSLMFLCHTCGQWWRRTVGDCGVRSTLRVAVSWNLWVFLYRELCCLESTVLHFSVFFRCLTSLTCHTNHTLFLSTLLVWLIHIWPCMITGIFVWWATPGFLFSAQGDEIIKKFRLKRKPRKLLGIVMNERFVCLVVFALLLSFYYQQVCEFNSFSTRYFCYCS